MPPRVCVRAPRAVGAVEEIGASAIWIQALCASLSVPAPKVVQEDDKVKVEVHMRPVSPPPHTHPCPTSTRSRRGSTLLRTCAPAE